MTLTTTSRFFQNYNYTGEQRLYQDLLDQCMRQYGIDVYYVKRNYVDFDGIYGEDKNSTFTDAVLIAGYIKNIMGFSGDNTFMSKFMGTEVRDQVVFTFTRRMFHEGIGPLPVPKGKAGTVADRPREGDLIYFPLNQRVYQIKFVDQYSMFFQIGVLMAWDCTCELFEYSQERFDTGIPGIDRMMEVSSNVLHYTFTDQNGKFLTDGTGNYLTTEFYVPEQIDPSDDQDDINMQSNNYIDWSEDNPFTDFTKPNQE